MSFRCRRCVTAALIAASFALAACDSVDEQVAEHHERGLALLEEGVPEKAALEFRNALEIEPKLPGARRALGVALMNSANDEPSRQEAQRQFEQELLLNPADALSEYQLGELMWIGNRPAHALKRFLRAIELQPNFPDALIAAGKVLISTDESEQAVGLAPRQAGIRFVE